MEMVATQNVMKPAFMRPLDDAEIDAVGGGVANLVIGGVIVAVALAAMLIIGFTGVPDLSGGGSGGDGAGSHAPPPDAGVP